MKTGKIIRIISNLYTVNIEGENMDCQARGKFRQEKITPLVGDYCEVDIENKYIMRILPRKNYLLRPSIANVDIALIVTSLKKPDYSNKPVIEYFEKNLKCISREIVSSKFQLMPEQRKAFIEMTPLLFYVEKEKINWDDLTY